MFKEWLHQFHIWQFSDQVHDPIFQYQYDPSTNKVIDVRDVIIDEVPIHNPPGSFPLLTNDSYINNSQHDSVDFSLYDATPIVIA